MTKDNTIFRILKVPKHAAKDYASQNNIKEMFLGYYYSMAYHNKFIDMKSLKQFWPFPPYNKSEIARIFNRLRVAISDENQFLEIADELLKKPWLDLYLEAVKMYPAYFRNHFQKHQKNTPASFLAPCFKLC